MCSAVASLDGLVGRDREDDLAPDVGMLARRQPIMRNSTPTVIWLEKSLMNSKRLRVADAVERAIGDLVRRLDQMLDVLPREGGLAQRAQPVVPRRVGGARALRPRGRATRRSCCPARTRKSPSPAPPEHVVVARQDPELAAFAPVAGILLAQHLVIRERIGVDFAANRDRMLPSASAVIFAGFDACWAWLSDDRCDSVMLYQDGRFDHARPE